MGGQQGGETNTGISQFTNFQKRLESEHFKTMTDFLFFWTVSRLYCQQIPFIKHTLGIKYSLSQKMIKSTPERSIIIIDETD